MRDQIQQAASASWEAQGVGAEGTARIIRTTLDSTSNVLREAAEHRTSQLNEAIVDALAGIDVGVGYEPHLLSRDQVALLLAPAVLTALADALDA